VLVRLAQIFMSKSFRSINQGSPDGETLSCEIEGLKTEGVVKHGPRLCRIEAHQDDARARSRLYKKAENCLCRSRQPGRHCRITP